MSKTHRKTTIKYHEDPPHEGESLIHYIYRTKNTLRCLLYYEVSLLDLFELLGEHYHCYPSRILYEDPMNRDDYRNGLS